MRHNDDSAAVRMTTAGIVVILGGLVALLFELVQVATFMIAFGFGFLFLGLAA